MVLDSLDKKTGGIIKLTYEDEAFSRSFFREKSENVLTIAWNKGADQQVDVDDTKVLLTSNHVIVLNANQSFRFDNAEDIIAWQFNREFYCIVDHDHEVSCAGLLFYGANGVPIIRLDDSDARKFDVLFQVFLDEFGEVEDNLKSEMLRVILKRLIVKLTRSYKVQNALSSIENKDLDVIRQFNLMVEKNYREFHQVQDYADLLNRSSKTISNIFSKYSEESPLETIHKRVLLEAKRLLIYTDKTTKEVAYETGFQDIPSFSRFFKKHTQLAPSKFREKHRFDLIGKN
ncbi:MAG: helix-turn-helix domain-containing protein [Bacteroidota bacterium]